MKDYIIYRLDVSYGDCDVSTPLNVDFKKDPFKDKYDIPMTDEEAIQKGMEMLKEKKNVRAWLVSKYYLPIDGGYAEHRKIIAQSENKCQRLDYREE